MVTTTDSGCPVDAPTEPEPSESAYPAMARIDDNGKVLEVQDRDTAERSKTARPSETWVPTFAAHPTKRLATTDLYYDDSLKDFGPKLDVPASVDVEQVFDAARLDLPECAAMNVDFILAVDPITTDNCHVDVSSIVVDREGSCLEEVRAVAKTESSDQRAFGSSAPTLTRKALMLLTPTDGGKDGGGNVGTIALSVSKAGSGSGTVTSSPSGLSCGGTCSVLFQQSTQVTLTATPAVGSRFAGWSGACSGTRTCRVTMSTARNVTATFNPA